MDDEYMDYTSETPEKIKEGGYDEIKDVDVEKKTIIQKQEQIPVPIPTPIQRKFPPLPQPTNYFPDRPNQPNQPKQKNPYKTTTIFLGVAIILIFLIWFNISFHTLSKKDFSLTNNIDVPENPVNITNEHTIINNGTTIINVDLGNFTDIIIERIMNELNLTNSTI